MGTSRLFFMWCTISTLQLLGMVCVFAAIWNTNREKIVSEWEEANGSSSSDGSARRLDPRRMQLGDLVGGGGGDSSATTTADPLTGVVDGVNNTVGDRVTGVTGSVLPAESELDAIAETIVDQVMRYVFFFVLLYVAGQEVLGIQELQTTLAEKHGSAVHAQAFLIVQFILLLFFVAVSLVLIISGVGEGIAFNSIAAGFILDLDNSLLDRYVAKLEDEPGSVKKGTAQMRE